MASILSQAVEDEVIVANPAHNIRNVIKLADSSEEVNPLTRQELTLLLDTVQEHFSEHYPLFLLLARTGMRVGEALGLQWGDIDFAGRFIEVKRSWTKGRITTPKGGKKRAVDMSLQLTEVLKFYTQALTSENLFTNLFGNLIDLDNWRRRVFQKALKKADLRKVRIHDLRHTYATLRISKGDNIADVSKQLGHHSVKLTMDVYYHWMPGKKKDEVDALDDPFYQHPSAPPPHPERIFQEKWASETPLTH